MLRSRSPPTAPSPTLSLLCLLVDQVRPPRALICLIPDVVGLSPRCVGLGRETRGGRLGGHARAGGHHKLDRPMLFEGSMDSNATVTGDVGHRLTGADEP